MPILSNMFPFQFAISQRNTPSLAKWTIMAVRAGSSCRFQKWGITFFSSCFLRSASTLPCNQKFCYSLKKNYGSYTYKSKRSIQEMGNKEVHGKWEISAPYLLFLALTVSPAMFSSCFQSLLGSFGVLLPLPFSFLQLLILNNIYAISFHCI